MEELITTKSALLNMSIDPQGLATHWKINMWRVVAVLALSLSGCVSTKPLDQAFGAGQGRRIINSEIAFLISGRASAGPASR